MAETEADVISVNACRLALLYIGEINEISVLSIPDSSPATVGFAPDPSAHPLASDSQIWPSSGVDSPIC